MIIPTPLVPVADDPYHALLVELTRLCEKVRGDNEAFHGGVDEAVWAFLRVVHPSAAKLIDAVSEDFWYA